MTSKVITTGCISIDELLNGGIEIGTITQIYGESGSGKTNFCLQITIQYIKNCFKKANEIFNQFIEILKSDLDIDFYNKIYRSALQLNIDIQKVSSEINIKKKKDLKHLILSIKNYIMKKNIKKVIFIDTEGISYDRFKQIAGFFYKEIAKNILIYEPMSLEEQFIAIKNIENIININIGLVIIDSATSYYRYELEDDYSNIRTRRELINQISFLHILTRKYKFATIMTNQVFSDITSGSSNAMKALGGKAIEHISKTILYFEKTGISKRTAKLIKHRSIQEGAVCQFKITQNGIN